MGNLPCSCLSSETGRSVSLSNDQPQLQPSHSQNRLQSAPDLTTDHSTTPVNPHEETKDQLVPLQADSQRSTGQRYDPLIPKLEPGNLVAFNKDAKLSDHYKVLKVLGRGKIYNRKGAFGRVERVEHLMTGDIRAAKYIMIKTPGDFTLVENEIRILRQLDHPNILRIYEYYVQGNMVILVTQLLDGGSLLQRIIAFRKYNEKVAGIIMWQLLSAVSYLHANQIMHSDIKPENIMMESFENEVSVKLIDFGVSKLLTPVNRKKYYYAGTQGYMAPEQAKGKPELRSDIWGLGVVLYILLSGEHPFEDFQGRIKLGLKFPPNLFGSVSNEAIQLVKAMLQRDPSKRIYAADALKNPWIIECARGAIDKGHALAQDSLKNLRNFQMRNKLQHAVLIYLATHFEIQDIKEAMKVAFSSLDSNGDGKLSRQEMRQGLINMGRSDLYADQTVHRIFEIVDFNHSGYIDYTEFIAANLEDFEVANDQKLQACFMQMDKNGDGYLDIQELREVVFPTLKKEAISEEEKKVIEDMFLSFPDKNKDGRVDISERVLELDERLQIEVIAEKWRERHECESVWKRGIVKQEIEQMASADKLRYAGFGSIKDTTLSFSYASDKKSRAYQEEYKKKAQALLTDLFSLGAKPGMRHREDSVFGTWYAIVDEELFAFLVLTHNTFEERHAYRLLEDLRRETVGLASSPSNPQIETFFPDLRRMFNQAFDTYGGPDGPANDQLSMAQQKVNQVQSVMQQNVKSLIDGQANLDQLEGQSHDLLAEAGTFKKNATELKNVMRKRAIKLYIIFGCIAVALLLYILVPLFT